MEIMLINGNLKAFMLGIHGRIKISTNMSFGFPSFQTLVPTYEAHPKDFKLFQANVYFRDIRFEQQV